MSARIRIGLMALAVIALLSLLAWFVAGAGDYLGGARQNNGGNDGNGAVQNGGLDDLAARCASSIGEDGFGRVTIDRHLTISGETGEISVPCRVRLERGGWLQLNNVELRSKHLSISDYEPNGETRVGIKNSELTATGPHGFLLQLSDAEDSVSIHHSKIDYPLSVWVRISDLNPEVEAGGGRMDVTNSTVRADDPESEDGIQFVADEIGGEAKFNKLRLDTGVLEGEFQNAMLFAGECEVHQVEGYPNRCGPEAIVDGLQE